MVKARLSEIWPLPRLIRAARGLAGIDQAELARQAGVSRHAVMAIEGDESETMDHRRMEIRKIMQVVLEIEFGIEFVFVSKKSGGGVRFKKPGS